MLANYITGWMAVMDRAPVILPQAVNSGEFSGGMHRLFQIDFQEMKSKLANAEMEKIWKLADMDRDGLLDKVALVTSSM